MEKEKGILTCPDCGHQQKTEIPTNACMPFYKCEGCQKIIGAEGDSCCVFCSYGDRPCPVGKRH